MAVLVSSISAFAGSTTSQSPTHQWCIWEGEEYLKAPVLNQGRFWMQVVYDLHTQGSEINKSDDFEGVGSCRFIPRSLGPNVAEAISAYLQKGVTIIPSRAYIKIDGDVKFVLPQAEYMAGTNLLVFNKDFYSLDVKACHEQKTDMIKMGQNSGSLRVDDIVFKKNVYGGVSAVVFEKSSAQSLYYGVCHFSQIQQ